MKSLVQYINEALYKNPFDNKDYFDKEFWDLGYKYYSKDTELPTLEEIEDAFGVKSIMDDPSFGEIFGMPFNKVDKDRWDVTNALHHLMGRSFTNEKILDEIKGTKEKWFLMLRKK